MSQDQLEDLAKKIMQADKRLGWHSAWIKAVRLASVVHSEDAMRNEYDQ